MENGKVAHVLLNQAGWIQVDKGSFQTSQSGSSQFMWMSNPGFHFKSEGKEFFGPTSTILAVKYEKP
jgi:hypothetical protein